MSIRSDIIDGRLAIGSSYGLIYTEVLGWIDLGHAQGEDIRDLLQQMNTGETSSSDKNTYEVKYAQGMVGIKRKITISRFIKWRIKKGRPVHERQSIALAMMLTVAKRFESMQSSFPFSLVTDSGFSGEDLISDLLGFYRVVSLQNPFPLLRPVSQDNALKRWDYYGPVGSFKNTSFRPILFPDPERFPGSSPRPGYLPAFMNTVQPYNDFKSTNVGIVSNDGTELEIKY
ncbi:hypothetical protein [Entomohabitans teleogrylli]|uniref:hypothetical protein n=1 Tax=Entomohabitans teleogrylli TaxID=1384589 RepID=UPI00073D1CFA|nr:hypothetical protein [Entomohabitans teleogrylli]